MSWLTNTYEGYETVRQRAEYALDVYSGAAEDKAVSAANSMSGGTSTSSSQPRPEEKIMISGDVPMTTNLGQYLYRRSQGEHPAAFRERTRITRFPLHLFSIITHFVGEIAKIENDATYTWGVLGSKDEPGTVMRSLWEDCDGDGTNWTTRMTEVMISLCLFHEVWYGVLPPQDKGLLPRFKIFDLVSVTNYRGRQEVLVKDKGTTLETIRQEEHETFDEYIYYTPEGWQRYRMTDKDDAILIDEGRWSQPFVGRHGRPRVPLGRVALPLRMPVGYRVARSNVHLYNLLSDVRNLVRVANHPNLRAEELSVTQYQQMQEERKLGFNTLIGPWDYIGPNPANAETGYEIYGKETRDTYVTSLQLYNDSPKVMTARQVDEQSGGRTAFLSILSDGADEVENDALFLSSQIVAPSSSSKWQDARMVRSKKFQVGPLQEVVEQLVPHTFGKDAIVPAGATGRLNAAMRYHKLMGTEVDEEEIKKEIGGLTEAPTPTNGAVIDEDGV